MTTIYQTGSPEAIVLLQSVVESCTYKPGWEIMLANMERKGEHLAGSAGWTLIVACNVQNVQNPRETVGAYHLFAVPPASWAVDGWERWVFDCIVEVETHEAMEFVRFGGHKAFYPMHGPGSVSPYLIERKRREL